MARPLRVEYAGAFYHVIARGNNRENLFKNEQDRLKFIEYLEKAVERFSIIIHTYCLMRNHYHLLVETPDANLSKAMQWVNVSYATYFNIKRRRHGHLFQGRFNADAYLKHLSRYIHLNPVRAKMVSSPAAYQWSSYGAFMGKQKAPQFVETDWLLSNFGKNKKEAQKNYQVFVEKTDASTVENPDKLLAEGFLLGDADFVNWVRATFLSNRKDEKEIPQLKKLKPKIALEDVVQAVAENFGCSQELILTKGRKKNKARNVAIYLARDMSGVSCKDLGEYFGGVNGPLITIMHKRIAAEASRNQRFSYRLDGIKKRILNI